MVVWLASFPRSGNTFVRILLEKLYGQQTQSLYRDDPACVFLNGNAQDALNRMRKSSRLHFVKTHELPDDESPAILLTRDGRDAMVSYAHFIEDYGVIERSAVGKFVAEWKARGEERLLGRPRFEQVLRRVVERRYVDWSALFRAWTGRKAPCAQLRFEEVIQRPDESFGRSLAALGLALERVGNAAVPSFAVLQASDPKFFRSGRTGQWREEMSTQTEELFWREHGAAMIAAGYRR